MFAIASYHARVWKGLAVGLFLLCFSAPVPAAEKLTFIHTDALGSPVAATDEQGNVVWRKSYKPYGEETQAPPTPAESRSFTGHVLDAQTGLLYAGARWMDPAVGRFMSVDPKGFTAGDPSSFNRYAYGNNNPYRYVDPDGQVPIDTLVDLGFVVYDAGQFLGAGAAYVVGALTGNPALQAVGREGMTETGIDLGASTAGLAIPYVSVGMAHGMMKVVPDTAVVVRGGTKELPPPGEVFSGAAGKTLEDAAAGVPHGQIRATTAGEIRAAGGTVAHAPERTRSGRINDKHVDICLGPGPCTFGPAQPNPVPKADRIQ